MTTEVFNESNGVLEAAQRYLSRGFMPYPIPHRSKSPTDKGWQKARFTEADLPKRFKDKSQNIGILLGEPSNGFVDVDLDCEETMLLAPEFLPDTDYVFGRHSKPRSHMGYIADPLVETRQFRDPTDGSMLVEFRSTGGQTVHPPSVHESGEAITWESEGEPARMDGKELRDAVARLAAAALLARHWPKRGSRQDCALALAGGLMRAGWDETQTRDFIEAVAETADDDEVEMRVKTAEYTARRLNEKGVATGWPKLAELTDEKVVRSVQKWLEIPQLADRPQALVLARGSAELLSGIHLPMLGGGQENDLTRLFPSLNGANMTDAGNAECMAALFGNCMRYCHTRKKWLSWDGMRWRMDESNKAMLASVCVARARHMAAGCVEETERRRQLEKWAWQSESAKKVAETLRLAEAVPPLATNISHYDVDPFLATVANGTVDLRSVSFRESRREDYLTKQLGVAFDGDATAPRWLQFVSEVFVDEDLISYIQRAVGYSLTGDTREQVLFLCHGSGANGKSVFLNVLSFLLGDYAARASFDTFDAGNRSTNSNDLAALAGKRLVTVSEIEADRRLAEAKVKAMTGGDAISCRFLHKEFFTYTPQYKIWMAMNYLPNIRGNDNGIWRRVHLIPFRQTFAGRADPKLEEKLKGEASGILNWAMGGLRAWHEQGLGKPSEVEKATEGYRLESDSIGQWLVEKTVQHESATVRAEEGYKDYAGWTLGRGGKPLTQATWGASMKTRGFEKKRRSTGFQYLGLGLLVRE